MDLSQFVDECLTQILVGIKNAQSKDPDKNIVASVAGGSPAQGLLMEAYGQVFTAVDFDVSIVAETTGGGKAEIKVFSFGGAEAGGSRATQHTSRVRFTIPLRLPEGDQSQAKKFDRPLQNRR